MYVGSRTSLNCPQPPSWRRDGASRSGPQESWEENPSRRLVYIISRRISGKQPSKDTDCFGSDQLLTFHQPWSLTGRFPCQLSQIYGQSLPNWVYSNFSSLPANLGSSCRHFMIFSICQVSYAHVFKILHQQSGQNNLDRHTAFRFPRNPSCFQLRGSWQGVWSILFGDRLKRAVIYNSENM